MQRTGFSGSKAGKAVTSRPVVPAASVAKLHEANPAQRRMVGGPPRCPAARPCALIVTHHYEGHVVAGPAAQRIVKHDRRDIAAAADKLTDLVIIQRLVEPVCAE